MEEERYAYPIPLRGTKYQKSEAAYIALSGSLFDIDYSNADERYLILHDMVIAAEAWLNCAQYSAVANECLVRSQISRAEIEISLNQYEKFVQTFEKLEPSLNDLVSVSTRDMYIRLKLAGSFLSLSDALLHHKFDSNEMWTQYYWTACGCLDLSLRFLEEIRQTWAVTQAVALRSCAVFNPCFEPRHD
jgi:hypothetical protein